MHPETVIGWILGLLILLLAGWWLYYHGDFTDPDWRQPAYQIPSHVTHPKHIDP